MIGRIATAAACGLAVCACATAQPIPVRGDTPGYECSNAAIGQFVGREASSELGSDMLRASGARRVRWVRPGMMVTMEFSPERLTVHLDEAGRVQRATCG